MTSARDSKSPRNQGLSTADRVREQVAPLFDAQSGMLDKIGDIQRSWFEALRTRVESANEFAVRLAGCSNPQEASALYAEWVSNRLEAFAADGRRFAEQWHRMCSLSLSPQRDPPGDGAAPAVEKPGEPAAKRA